MTSIYHTIPLYLSSEVNLDLKVYISHLDASALPIAAQDQIHDVYISVQLLSCGVPQHEIARATQIPSVDGTNLHWDEWITVPFKIRDISRTDQLAISLVGVGHRILAGTCIRLFDHKMRLKRGLQQLMLWPSSSALSWAQMPGNRSFLDIWPPKRPGMSHPDVSKSSKESVQCSMANRSSALGSATPKTENLGAHTGNDIDELVSPTEPVGALYYWDEDFALAKTREAYERGDMTHAPWLDRLTIRQLESHRNRRTVSRVGEDMQPTGIKLLDPHQLQMVEPAGENPSGKPDRDLVAIPVPHDSDCKAMMLYIQFPYFPHPVVYDEQMYEQHLRAPGMGQVMPIHSLWEMPGAGPDPRTCVWAQRMNILPDPEIDMDNPVEIKYSKLTRDLVRGIVDPNLKPNRQELQILNNIILSPNHNLPSSDNQLLWKFRYSLLSNKKALTKFVKACDWDDEEEASQAAELIEQWALIDAEDALRLLAPDFQNSIVRQFAVKTLQRCSDDELVSFLLQLVQALRYERELAASARTQAASAEEARQGNLVGFADNLGPKTFLGNPDKKENSFTLSPLADFIIHRASRSSTLASYLHWYLSVETEDPEYGNVFGYVHRTFLMELRKTAQGRHIDEDIARQAEFVSQVEAAAQIAKSRQSIEKKNAKLNQSISPGGEFADLGHLAEPVLLPLDPTRRVVGLQPGKCKVFKSSVYPVLLSCTCIHNDTSNTTDKSGHRKQESSGISSKSRQQRTPSTAGSQSDLHERSEPDSSSTSGTVETYQLLVKIGDDLRQDQLIIQMIQLMDRCLKRVNVDLHLTPYRVLATSTNSGVVEFVGGSVPVDKVKNDIIGFFRQKHAHPPDPYGVDRHVMMTYVKSCAGYCVITYLLGVGDRHFDNLLIQNTGHLFHIDFGFIFGRDPKPLQPPMKITKQMIEGMGGVKSEYYRQFRSVCCQAYTIIRRSATLFLNLLNLMRDAGIKDMGSDPDVTLMKVQEKFRLDIDDEAAERVFLDQVDESVAALFPHLTDFIHNIVTKLR